MASKAGLNVLTKTMTIEWVKYNIQPNAVCPIVIMTPMGEMVWGDPKILASPASDLFADGRYKAV
jgi:NAD(P)-dependent dehydrogenase (short-subunit alcohol dehydrogenase family)